MLNARRTGRLTDGDDRIGFVPIEPVLGCQRGFGGVEREVAGAVEDQAPMLAGKGGSGGVEFQEASPSPVMYLGCVVVHRGRIERLGRDTVSCLGRVSSRKRASGLPKRPGPVAWGRL